MVLVIFLTVSCKEFSTVSTLTVKSYSLTLLKIIFPQPYDILNPPKLFHLKIVRNGLYTLLMTLGYLGK